MSDFRSYIGTMLPGYDSFLDEEQINYLLELYREWEKHDRIASNCLHRHLSSSAKVDYSTDFEKQMDIAAQHGRTLVNAINNIKKVYGLDKQEDSTLGKTY